jgi:hypothetical protein
MTSINKDERFNRYLDRWQLESQFEAWPPIREDDSPLLSHEGSDESFLCSSDTAASEHDEARSASRR